MKHIITILMLLVATFSVVVSQTKSKRETQNAKVAEDIKRLDREWLIESYRSTNDMSAFDRIVADDFMITHSRGKFLNKAQKRADIIGDHPPSSAPTSAPPSDPNFKIEDSSVLVRVYKDVAISTGYIIERDLSRGKNDRVYFTNTYLKRKGRWQVVASQLTRVPQPK